MDAHIQRVNIKGCKSAAGFKPPPGSHKAWNLTGPSMTMGQDSYLFQQKGHVHDGGESMTVSINGKLVCTSQAKYGGKLGTMFDANGKATWQTIDSMGQCTDLIALKKGDMVVLEAFYDDEKHPLRASHGGMGTVENEEMG